MIKLFKFKRVTYCVCLCIAIYTFYQYYKLCSPNGSIKKIQFQENFNINDILIVVKSSSKFYSTRLQYIYSTWYQFAKSQTYVVSDTSDQNINQLFGKYYICF